MTTLRSSSIRNIIWNFLVMLCPWNPSSSFFSFWRNKRFCKENQLCLPKQGTPYRTTSTTTIYHTVNTFLFFYINIFIISNYYPYSKSCNNRNGWIRCILASGPETNPAGCSKGGVFCVFFAGPYLLVNFE